MAPSLRPPDNWLRAALAGVEAALLPWLLVIAGAFVTYVGTASAPGTGNVTWGAAAAVATRAWALALGGHIAVEEGVISLAPLGLTLLAIVLQRGALRRHGVAEPGGVGVAVLASTLTAAVIALLGGAGTGWHLVGALVVAGIGGASALEPAVRRDALRWLRGAADPVGVGLAAAGRATGLALLGGAALVAVAVITSWDQVRELHDALRPDVASAIVLVLAQVLYLPTLALWALGWASGPGFAVGDGTHYSALGSTTELLPAIPALGALPMAHAPWALALPVVVGVVAATWRTSPRRRWAEALLSTGAFGIATFTGFLLLGLAASGSIGPERMSAVGVDALPVAGALSGLMLGGFGITTVLRHPAVRARFAATAAVARAAVVGDDDAAEPARETPVRVPEPVTAPTAPTGTSGPTAATIPTAPSFASALTAATAPTAPSAATAGADGRRDGGR